MPRARIGLFLVPENRAEKSNLKGLPLSTKESSLLIKDGTEGVFIKTSTYERFLLFSNLTLSWALS